MTTFTVFQEYETGSSEKFESNILLAGAFTYFEKQKGSDGIVSPSNGKQENRDYSIEKGTIRKVDIQVSLYKELNRGREYYNSLKLK